MISINGDMDDISEFEFKDIYHAIRQFRRIRTKNRIPSFTYEGQTRLKIDISITKAKHIHVNWRK